MTVINGKVFVNPGELKTPIKLKRPNTQQSAGGFQTPAPIVFAETMAKWVDDYGQSLVAAEASGAVRPATVTFRYVAGVDETTLIELDGEDYQVNSVENVRKLNQWLVARVSLFVEG